MNVLLFLAEGSHEWGGPVCFHYSLSIDVVVIPSLVEPVLQEVVNFFTLLSEMSLDDLSCKLLGLVPSDEKLSAWQSFFGHAFCCIILNHVGSESVDRGTVFSIEVSWQGSVVGILPLASVLVVTNKTVKACWESSESWIKLLNSSVMS